MSLAAAAALAEKGVCPAAAAGFSLGEVTALTFAGAFSAEEGFSLVTKRGALMQKDAAENPGKMAAVLRLAKEDVERLCAEYHGVWPVNYNSPGQIAVAGRAEVLNEFAAAVKSAGGRATILAVSGAFHSPLMTTASNAFYQVVRERESKKTQIPVYANATAQPYEKDTAALLAQQIRSPVLWQQTIENLAAEGFDTFIETGPGKVLSGLIARILPETRTFQCDSIEAAEEIAKMLEHDGV